jgi:hypothetical protein
MYGFSGVGLRGGTFEVAARGEYLWRNLHYRLNKVWWVSGVKVSGEAHWNRATGHIRADVRVSGKNATPGRLRLRWNDSHRHAVARAAGTLGGVRVDYRFPAP